MAFNPKEQAIIDWAAKNGKSSQEARDAILRFRATGSPADKQVVPTSTREQMLATRSEDVATARKSMEDFALSSAQMAQEGIRTLTSKPEVTGVRETAQELGAGYAALEAVAQAGKAGSRGVGALGKIVGGALGVIGAPVLAPATKYISEKIPQEQKDRFMQFAAENPRVMQEVENVADISALLIGPATRAATGAIGTVTERGTSAAVRTATDIKSLADNISQVSTPAVSVTVPTIKKGSVLGSIASDVIPKATEVRDQMIANAFKFAPVEDLARIESKTGNKIGDFLARNNLLKDNLKDTAQAIDDFYRKNYSLARDAIANADSVYTKPFTFGDLPEAKIVVDSLVTDLSKVDSPTFNVLRERLMAIQQSGEFDLLQLQEIKSLSDQIDSIYSRSGEVRPSLPAQAKDDAISGVRRFLEDRTKEAIDIDIRPINNNTMTAREIADASARRAGKASTASIVSLTDLSTLGFGTVVSPFAGVGALGVKKILTSPTTQLRIARWLAGKSDEFNGMTAKELKQVEELVRGGLKEAADISD